MGLKTDKLRVIEQEKVVHEKSFDITCKKLKTGDILVEGFGIENKSNKFAWHIQKYIESFIVGLIHNLDENKIHDFYELNENGLILKDFSYFYFKELQNINQISIEFDIQEMTRYLVVRITKFFNTVEQDISYIVKE